MRDVTVVIPAYNEEKNIEAAIDSVVGAVCGVADDYEIIVVNDGSRDRTGDLAEEKAKRNPKINVLHNEENYGYGYAFSRGVREATKSYVTGFPGDNDASSDSLRRMILEIKDEDLLLSYMANTGARPLWRRFVSRAFVIFMNLLFGLRLRYYNGLIISRRHVIQSTPIKSTGLATIAEFIVRALKNGHSYREVAFEHTGRKGGASTALRFSNIKSVVRTILILITDIYFVHLKKRKTTCTIS